MATENTINLYKHYLTVPGKAKHAADLLQAFPELAEKPKEEEPKKEVKPNGKKPKR